MSRVQDTELKLCVEIYTHPRISQRDFPVMRFVQHKSTETKMINNSLASTRRADRQHHKASHARRKEKKWRARERSHGFIMLGMESAAAGCDIPNYSLAGIIHAIKIQSIGSLFVIVTAPETLWHTKRKLSTWLIFILASKFIQHPSVSQWNFSAVRFVQHKSTETRMKNISTK